jgi:hypothetical protein
MIHPVESASPSRAARIQRGEDEAQRRRWTFYEAVLLGRGLFEDSFELIHGFAEIFPFPLFDSLLGLF